MDIATTAVVVRRETKSCTLSVDALRALALTAVKNCVDPAGSGTFVDQDAAVNEDGSITVSVSMETVIPEAPPAPKPALQTTVPAAQLAIPTSIG